MSQIVSHNPTKHEIACLQTMDSWEQKFIRLRQENPFKSYSEVQQKAICLTVLTKAFVEGTPNGQPDADILKFQTGHLQQELSGKFGALTVSEIKYAFDMGIRGETGPYFGMCAKTYHQFLKWMFELPERTSTWLKYLERIETFKFSDKPLYFTPEKFREIAVENFKTYKETGKLPFAPHAIYDTIKEMMGVSTLFDKKSWENVRNEAREAIKKRYAGKNQVDNLKLALSPESKSLEYECKSIGVKMFFDKLISEGKELTINQK